MALFFFLSSDFIDKSLTYHSTHTFWDQSMGQADVSLGVMRLYQKDLAEQCWIGWGKSGFQLSPYFMLGNLKRRLKAPKFWVGNPLFCVQDSVILETGMWRAPPRPKLLSSRLTTKQGEVVERGDIDVAQQKAFKSPGPHLNSNLQLERLGKVAPLGK